MWPKKLIAISDSTLHVFSILLQQIGKSLHPLPIPNEPWGSIGMDFVGPFPKSRGCNYLWVVICRLTSMVHLTPMKITIKSSELDSLYVKEIVHLHGL